MARGGPWFSLLQDSGRPGEGPDWGALSTDTAKEQLPAPRVSVSHSAWPVLSLACFVSKHLSQPPFCGAFCEVGTGGAVLALLRACGPSPCSGGLGSNPTQRCPGCGTRDQCVRASQAWVLIGSRDGAGGSQALEFSPLGWGPQAACSTWGLHCGLWCHWEDTGRTGQVPTGTTLCSSHPQARQLLTCGSELLPSLGSGPN